MNNFKNFNIQFCLTPKVLVVLKAILLEILALNISVENLKMIG